MRTLTFNSHIRWDERPDVELLLRLPHTAIDQLLTALRSGTAPALHDIADALDPQLAAAKSAVA